MKNAPTSIVLYGTLVPPLYGASSDYTPIQLSGGITVYVRAELDAGDALSALDGADPRVNEIVLNTLQVQ
jgi:hypothetical protein